MIWCSPPRILLGNWRNTHACFIVLSVSKGKQIVQFCKTHPGLAPVSVKSTGTECICYVVHGMLLCTTYHVHVYCNSKYPITWINTKLCTKHALAKYKMSDFLSEYVFTSHKYLLFIHFKFSFGLTFRGKSTDACSKVGGKRRKHWRKLEHSGLIWIK